MDYNIYIHSDITDSLAEKTVPFDLRGDAKTGNTSAGGDASVLPFGARQLNQAFNIATGQTGVGQMAFDYGVSSLKKAVPIVSLVIAGIQIIDSTISSGVQHLSDYTGQYEYSLRYNNFKTTISSVLNPVKMTRNYTTNLLQMKRENEAVRTNNLLIGSSTLKNITRGV